MPRELAVCYLSGVDGAWVPLMRFARHDLRQALRTARRLAHDNALKSPWCLKRKRKVILRIPHRLTQETP